MTTNMISTVMATIGNIRRRNTKNTRNIIKSIITTMTMMMTMTTIDQSVSGRCEKFALSDCRHSEFLRFLDFGWAKRTRLQPHGCASRFIKTDSDSLFSSNYVVVACISKLCAIPMSVYISYNYLNAKLLLRAHPCHTQNMVFLSCIKPTPHQ